MLEIDGRYDLKRVRFNTARQFDEEHGVLMLTRRLRRPDADAGPAASGQLDGSAFDASETMFLDLPIAMTGNRWSAVAIAVVVALFLFANTASNTFANDKLDWWAKVGLLAVQLGVSLGAGFFAMFGIRKPV